MIRAAIAALLLLLGLAHRPAPEVQMDGVLLTTTVADDAGAIESQTYALSEHGRWVTIPASQIPADPIP